MFAQSRLERESELHLDRLDLAGKRGNNIQGKNKAKSNSQVAICGDAETVWEMYQLWEIKGPKPKPTEVSGSYHGPGTRPNLERESQN